MAFYIVTRNTSDTTARSDWDCPCVTEDDTTTSREYDSTEGEAITIYLEPEDKEPPEATEDDDPPTLIIPRSQRKHITTRAAKRKPPRELSRPPPAELVA